MNAVTDFLAAQGLDPFLVGLISGAVLGALLVGLFSGRRTGGDGGFSPSVRWDLGSLDPGKTTHDRFQSIRINRNGEEQELDLKTVAAIWQALEQGHKIEAIKILREASGLGLKEAKDLVEAMENAR